MQASSKKSKLKIRFQNFILNFKTIKNIVLLDLKKLTKSTKLLLDLFRSSNNRLMDIVKFNIDLGFEHLRIGNINDALMRFWLVKNLFDKNNLYINHYLGWLYFIKNNIKKSHQYFKASSLKESKIMHDFLEHISDTKEIPNEVLLEYKKYAQYLIAQRWNNPKYVPEIVVTALLDTIQKINREYTILDLGASYGEFGIELANRINISNHKLIALEDDQDMVDYLSALVVKESNLYSGIINSSIRDFLVKDKSEVYDIVVSLNSLNFSKNLDKQIVLINDIIASNGYFILLLRTTNNETYFDYRSNNFIYNRNEILLATSNTKLELKYSNNIQLNKFDTYAIFVLQKQ